MNVFEIAITEEQADYLQRLGMDVDTRYDIVNRIIESHRDDPTPEVITSPVFEHYHKLAEEAKLAYETAKLEFGETFLRKRVEEKLGKEDVNFTWSINDFSSLKAVITVA